MRNCENCDYGSYVLNCNTGKERLFCCIDEYEFEVLPDHVCSSHKYIPGYIDGDVLGYDCDDNEICEFRVLRYPFSAEIENWKQEPNVDPRFYCLIKYKNGNVYGVSIYDDYNSEYIRKFENIDKDDKIPMLIKTVSEMSYYEVAFSGITGDEWYYDRDRNKLKHDVESKLNQEKVYRKK